MFDLSPPLSSPQTSESFSRFQVWLKTEPGSLRSNVSDEVRCPPVKTRTNHRIPGPAQMMNMSRFCHNRRRNQEEPQLHDGQVSRTLINTNKRNKKEQKKKV